MRKKEVGNEAIKKGRKQDLRDDVEAEETREVSFGPGEITLGLTGLRREKHQGRKKAVEREERVRLATGSRGLIRSLLVDKLLQSHLRVR